MLRHEFLAIAALLAAFPALAQQPGQPGADPAPSGVLVSRPPSAFYDSVRNAILTPRPASVTLPPALARQPIVAVPSDVSAAGVCAIPLVEVPIRQDLDNGIFLKEGAVQISEPAMMVSPPAPPCPAQPRQ